MGQLVIGIGEYKVSAEKTDIIKTYALGSCVAVIIYDKVQNIAGMIHIALPESSIDHEKAGQLPGYFADTGLPVLIEEMKKYGVKKTNIWIKLVGGSNVMDKNYTFDIGKRNILAVKKILWKDNLGPLNEDTGGSISRTVSLSVSNGEITISSGNKQWQI